jgi:hypothetical protein
MIGKILDTRGALYQCKDGTFSTSNGRGACVFHGGLKSERAVYANRKCFKQRTKTVNTQKDLFRRDEQGDLFLQKIETQPFLNSNIWVRDTLIDKDLVNALPIKKRIKILSLIDQFKKSGYIDVRTEMGPDQWARVSKKRKEEISKTQIRVFAIESEIKELLKSDEQVEKERNAESIKKLTSRKTQLTRQIDDLKSSFGRRLTGRENGFTRTYNSAVQELNEVNKLLGINEVLPQIEIKNTNKVEKVKITDEELIFLALNILQNAQETARGNIQIIAKWIGEARRVFVGLTNTHENELYDWLVTGGAYGTTTAQISNERVFLDRLQSIVNRKTQFGQIDEFLNIQNNVSKSPTEREYERQINELKQEITRTERELTAKTAELAKRGGTEQQIKSLTEGLEATLRRKRIEYQNLYARKSAAMEAARGEQSLFDSIGWIKYRSVKMRGLF